MKRSLSFALALGTLVFVAPCAAQAQAPAQSAAAKECLRLNAQPADQIPWDQHERVYKQWADGGNKPDARRALQTAADTCPKTFYEYNGAVAELKRLGN